MSSSVPYGRQLSGSSSSQIPQMDLASEQLFDYNNNYHNVLETDLASEQLFGYDNPIPEIDFEWPEVFPELDASFGFNNNSQEISETVLKGLPQQTMPVMSHDTSIVGGNSSSSQLPLKQPYYDLSSQQSDGYNNNSQNISKSALEGLPQQTMPVMSHDPSILGCNNSSSQLPLKQPYYAFRDLHINHGLIGGGSSSSVPRQPYYVPSPHEQVGAGGCDYIKSQFQLGGVCDKSGVARMQSLPVPPPIAFNSQISDPKKPSASIEEGLIKLCNTQKQRKPKNEVDKAYRAKQKRIREELEDNFKKLGMENTRLQVLWEGSEAKRAKIKERANLLKAENAKLGAALESSRSDLSKAEKILPLCKFYVDARKQVLPRLQNLIVANFSCESKEEVWEKFANPGGKEAFEKYWEENKNYKDELMSIAEMFLHLPQ